MDVNPHLKDQWPICDGMMMNDGDLIYGVEFAFIEDGIGGNRWKLDEVMKEVET